MRNYPENVVPMRRELAKIRKRIYMAALDMRYPLHERINSRNIDLTDMVGGFFSLNKSKNILSNLKKIYYIKYF